MPENASSLAEPVLTFIGVIIVALVTWLVARVQKKGQPEHALIDQLQEERDKDRERIDRLEASHQAMAADLSNLQVKEATLLIYVSALRHHIDSGSPPPPPPWPTGLQPFTTN
ncbi:MAG: hypothetical protein ACTHZD_15520 [Micrococcaceae bacterium]